MAYGRFRSDDATEQRAHEDGHACAQNELQSGHPGYFYQPGDGDFIHAVDQATGLPIFTFGDVYQPGSGGWINGFHAGTKQFIADHGLPWNSRLGVITELADIKSYFCKRSQTERPAALTLAGPLQSSPDGSVSLALTNDARWGRGEVSVVLTSSRLYCGGYGGAYRTGRMTATEIWDDVGSESPPAKPSRRPSIQPGTRNVWLRFYRSARTIEFFWGPPGSEVCFFRFDGLTPSRSIACKEECFAALDLQLGDWLPPDVPGLTRCSENRGERMKRQPT